MICELVKSGKRIGVTALSHKVIRKLLDDVMAAAHEMSFEECGACIATRKAKRAKAWLSRESTTTRRGARCDWQGERCRRTSWLWSPEAAFEAVDVLFIDEAGQMSLADVLAVSQAGRSWCCWVILSNWSGRRRGVIRMERRNPHLSIC